MIYLDHHAATPLCSAARGAMLDADADAWANPASVHTAGRAARRLLEHARHAIAAAIGSADADLVLTSGGSEACNLGVRGLALPAGSHLVTTEIEHPAVARPIDVMESERGVAVTRLSVPAGAAPDAEVLAQALRPNTRLVALQWVNHETGTLLPVEAYARVCRQRGVPLFVDATQAAGKLPIDVDALGADLLALAAHKLGGPAGAGALWVRRGLSLDAQLLGGAQERGRRAGSPGVAAVVGFGAACGALEARLAAQPRLAQISARVQAALRELGAALNATAGVRVATVVNASVPGWNGAELVAALDMEGVCVASGAACSSGLAQPSPVLRAMHADEPWRAGSALRLSWGPETTEAEVDRAISVLQTVVPRGASGVERGL